MIQGGGIISSCLIDILESYKIQYYLLQLTSDFFVNFF